MRTKAGCITGKQETNSFERLSQAHIYLRRKTTGDQHEFSFLFHFVCRFSHLLCGLATRPARWGFLVATTLLEGVDAWRPLGHSQQGPCLFYQVINLFISTVFCLVV